MVMGARGDLEASAISRLFPAVVLPASGFTRSGLRPRFSQRYHIFPEGYRLSPRHPWWIGRVFGILTGMSDAPDLEALARRYLDLWQDQMSAMASDPAMVEALSRTFTLMTQGAAAFASGTAEAARAAATAAASPAPSAGGDTAHGRQTAARPDAAASPTDGDDWPPPGTTAAAAASGDPGVDVPDLLRRLAALEQRVADLESGAASSSPGPAPGKHPAAKRSRRRPAGPADGA